LNTSGQTPDEINNGFASRNSANPHTLAFDGVLLDKKEAAFETYQLVV
jgi:hypothetical protein